MQLVFLELNEINFEFIDKYIDKGELPNFNRVFNEFGYRCTVSEKNYDELEPWIQWVTAHTGLELREHGVYRLGDIVEKDITQIWEDMESLGYTVGAVSPMNAKNRTNDACFFIPDPWTNTKITAKPMIANLCRAISQAVNDNASGKLKLGSVYWLIMGFLLNARPKNYLTYLKLLFRAKSKKWNKALFLDLLLSDLYLRQLKSKKPNFSSLFLNAGAHIQHHYMFSSTVYDGDLKNPNWYVANSDPVLDVYRLYDQILGDVLSENPGIRLMLATGLHQDPHPKVTYYWRLINHQKYLEEIGLRNFTVKPRMSRDFLIDFSSETQALEAEKLFSTIIDFENNPLFEVDNRGRDLFVTLIYEKDITESFEYYINGRKCSGLHEKIAFVAIKNGQHNGLGYFLDSGNSKKEMHSTPFLLKDIPALIKASFLETGTST